MTRQATNPRAVQRFVWTLSIAVPLIVTGLYLIPPAEGLSEETLRQVFWLPDLMPCSTVRRSVVSPLHCWPFAEEMSRGTKRSTQQP